MFEATGHCLYVLFNLWLYWRAEEYDVMSDVWGVVDPEREKLNAA
jgi:hypothetical protein